MRIFLIFGLVLSLGACSGGGSGSGISSLNPFNWFGGGARRAEQRASLQPGGGFANPADPRPLVDQVTRVTAERTTGGLIVTATGVPSTQGWYEAELVRVPTEDASEAVFQFHAWPPLRATRVGPDRSREIVAGQFLTQGEAAGIRVIRIIGARNNATMQR